MSAPPAPGGVIGILGGGQLGRMLAMAAARLGYRAHVFAPPGDNPAFDVCAARTEAAYDDGAALDAFAAAVDVVTYEFENVPVATVERLARGRPVWPDALALRTAQDRLEEKTFLQRAGVATAAFAAVDSAADAAAAAAAIGMPAILKTRRLGYDGKGQVRLENAADPARAVAEAWRSLGEAPCLLERVVPFALEASVLVARGVDGTVATFDLVENEHRAQILHRSRVPAAVAPEVAARAEAVGRAVAEALGYVGVLAVELFVAADGALIANEIAPRVHNSGHWTLDACVTDQFEQHIRAVCGLPLGSPERLADAEMTNLLGDDAGRWREILADPSARLHLYGKAVARTGRKMGHVTRLRPRRGT